MKHDIGTQINMVSPVDTNQRGTVFGGKVLEWADQAGQICAQHFSKKPVLTASLEKVDFLSPIHVGEEAHITPKLIFAHKRSMQVSVDIKSFNPFKNIERPTSKILLSYVAINEKTGKPTKVPQWKKPFTREAKALRNRLIKRLSQKNAPLVLSDDLIFQEKSKAKQIAKKPMDSRIQNHHLVMPGDHNSLDYLFAGRYLAWIDIVGAISASRHCESPVVTASMEEVDFKKRVPRRSTVYLNAFPVFTSKRSVQIKVSGYLWLDGIVSNQKIADAYLTFVALHRKTGKPIQIPQLKLSNSLERELYLHGKWRYDHNKKKP